MGVFGVAVNEYLFVQTMSVGSGWWRRSVVEK
jgi:hypothetical protein